MQFQPSGGAASQRSLVTVVVRSYNAERYIADAVKSILLQTYRGPIEVLVCHDDGSRTDEAVKVVDRIRRGLIPENRSIEVVRHPHMSPFRSLLECGMKYAEGDYIAFLDYDNFYSRSFIETAVREIERSRAVAGYGRLVSVDSNLRPLKQAYPRPLIVKDLILLGNYVDISSIVMKAELAKKLYNIFTSKLSHMYYDWIFEDYLLAMYLARSKEKTIPIPSAVYFYRVHDSNITAGARRGEPRYYLNLERIIKTYLAYLEIFSNDVKATELLYVSYAMAKMMLRTLYAVHTRYLLSNKRA